LTEEPGRGRLASRLFPDGEEPDPRFTLANERTFLAWIRTSLAFLAGGIALEAFAVPIFDEAWRRVLAVALIGVGVLISLGAASRWIRVERSMRRRRALPVPLIVPLLSFSCGAAMVVVILAILR
jgi:putative membrane protein